MTTVAGINGFGRFGLHLLKYWLDRRGDARYSIDYINDDTLDLEQALACIRNDPYVRFDDYRVEGAGGSLAVTTRDGFRHRIAYTHQGQADIPWLGEPELFFECTGKYTESERCQAYFRDKTKLVMVSATSWDADLTLVYGFNHDSFDPAKHRIISYGSCTVNGFVPLASYMHGRFGVIDADVSVVHNIPAYKLAGHNTLLRKFCTLERSGPQLLPFLNPTENFVVNYSVVPWTGVSMIDFRFRLKAPVARDDFHSELEAALADGPLKGLYSMETADVGPQAHNCTPFSAVFIKEGVKVRGDNVYLQGYFDTENSVNRFHDLVNHVSGSLS